MILRRAVLICLLAVGARVFADPPNLVLLSVDTLRADFLGCYGCDWDISPNIDDLADSGLVFEDALCEIPLTAPSFSAMFTSRYPRMVGVTRNGLRVDDTAPLITEHVRDAGYYTFAVQSNWTLKGKLCGLNRGFDVYEDDYEQRRWAFYKGERNAERVSQIAQELLKNRPADKPFFAWIHFSDPHAPYHYHREFSPVKTSLYKLDRKERSRVKYASEVAYTDYHIGRVFKSLPENTIVVFAADHGESLYEHGYLGHGRNLHQPSTHVPLIIRAVNVALGRTNTPVGTMDVGKTILGLLGIGSIPGMLGCNILHETIPHDRARFMETYGGAVPGLPGMKQLLEATSPVYQSVVKEGFKLICSENQRPVLYYLPDDADERRNLAPHQPALYEELNALLELWNKTFLRGKETVVELTEEDREALKSLGYLD
jgi:choline-sulfatase